MESLNLPFLPPSIVEQWLLAVDADEICVVLEEIIDLYRACSTTEKKRLSPREIFVFIQQVVSRIETTDTALQLNCLRLLRLLAEDHALLFVELAFIIYSKIQTMLQSPSRLVRTSTLSFAGALSAAIPLYNIADSILSLVENRPQHREYGFKVVSVSLLNLTKQAVCTTISESHKRLLKAYVIRLANCAALEVQVKLHVNDNDRPTEESKSISHAAMDLLAVACLAGAELEKAGQQTPALSPQVALRSLISSLCALQSSEVQLDNGTEREICRRSKSLDFPSLAEESIYSVVKPLISAIQSPEAANVSGLTLESPTATHKKAATGSGKAAGHHSLLSEVLVDSDASPTNNSNKHSTRRSIANIRKSWSSSADKIPHNVDFSDPDAAVSSIAAQFSPPKLTAARSFHGSPTATAPLSARGEKSGGQSASKAETSKSAYMPSWSAGKTNAEKERTEPLTRGRTHISGRKFMEADEPRAVLETQSSRHGSVGESSLASSSLQSHSSSMQSIGLSIRDPYMSSGRSHLGDSFDEDQSPSVSQHGTGTGTERMGKSLRLLKSPHSRHQLAAETAEGSFNQSYSSSAGKSRGDPIDENGYSYFEDPSRTPHELHSASNETFSPYVPSGRRDPGTSADGEEEDLNYSVSQSFDSASKARLKRTRLKSANAMAASYEAAQDSSDDLKGSGRVTSPRLPTGRHVVSRSETGLDKQLNSDDRPIGGAHQRAMSHGYNYSSEDLQGSQDLEASAGYGAPSPAKQRVAARRNKAQTSEAPSEPAQTNLSDVISVILKPDTTYDYIPSEDITPCNNPAQEMNKAYKGLETQDWPEIFHTLNTFRKLALHHPMVLVNAGTLHNVVLLIMKRVDALRSSLAKNALLTIDDMFRGLGKHIDAEVATIVPGILKRSIDSSSFLVESADTALQSMVENVSLTRSLGGLLLHVTHRSATTRSKVAICLHALVHAKGGELPTSKEFESFKSLLPKLLQDAAPETRSYSRETVRVLVDRQIVSRAEFEVHIPVDLLDKILRESCSTVLSQTVCSRNIGTAPGSADYGSSSPLRSATKRAGSRNPSSATPSRSGAFTPTGDGHEGDWSAAENSYGTQETPTRDRQHRASRHRPTPNKVPSLDLEGDDHDMPHLRMSSEQLSAHLDARLVSPARSPTHAHAHAQKGSPTHRAQASYSSSGEAISAVKAHSSAGSKSNTGHTSTSGASGASGASLAVAAAAKRSIDQDPELSNLQEILASTTVSSWTARKDAVDKVTELILKHYDVLRDANKLSGCVDCLLARLEDGSVKVHMHTIGCLERLNEEEPLVLQHNLMQIVVPAVMGSAASTNKLISGKSVMMLRLLFDTLTPLQVAQYLCQTALHDKDKLRLTALKFLADVMPVFCADQDAVLSIAKKVIFPMLCKLLFTATTKADMRVSGVECVRTLQNCLRPEKIWLWADDPHQQEELKRITSAS